VTGMLVVDSASTRIVSRRADLLADRAVAALVAEATLTPKPGLVDLRGAGAHDDMDVETLLRSAESLRETFAALADAGVGQAPSQALRERLAEIGRVGESRMLAVTGGVNTHRGAIWALGLVVAAAAGAPAADADAILARAAAIAGFDDRYVPRPLTPTAATPGSRARARYRVAGAGGEAQAGFPHAASALATLRRGTAADVSVPEARLDALLTVIAELDDTCLLNRGGLDGLRRAQAGASRVLSLGGVVTPAGARALEDLDAALTGARLSPGGSADLLALAVLLHSLESDPLDIATPVRKDI
jgi:triphosphoribosyl-dephospho-CoA synthase